MKKTLHIDDRLLAEARKVSGASTDTEAVRLGLESLLRHAAYERLPALRGSEPTARKVTRKLRGRGIGWIDAHLLASFKEFPIRQKPASFNLDAVMQQLSAPRQQ